MKCLRNFRDSRALGVYNHPSLVLQSLFGAIKRLDHVGITFVGKAFTVYVNNYSVIGVECLIGIYVCCGDNWTCVELIHVDEFSE